MGRSAGMLLYLVGARFDPVRVNGLGKPHSRPPLTGLGRWAASRRPVRWAEVTARSGGAHDSLYHQALATIGSLLTDSSFPGNCTDALCTFTTNPFHAKQQPPLVNMALICTSRRCTQNRKCAKRANRGPFKIYISFSHGRDQKWVDGCVTKLPFFWYIASLRWWCKWTRNRDVITRRSHEIRTG